MNDTSSKFMVWWVPQIPMKAFRFPVPDISTGMLLCEALGCYDLFQYENNTKPDYSNAGGIEFLDDDGDWVTLDPNDPDDVAYVTKTI